MPYLRFHAAPEVAAPPASLPVAPSPVAPPLRATHQQTLHLAANTTRDVITQVEREMDLVDRRLENLRALADQFGLDGDDGPRVA